MTRNYRERLTIRALGMLALLHCAVADVQPVLAQAEANPWTVDRKRAVARIEVKANNSPLKVGSGVIVRGALGNFYVLTSSHVLVPGYDPTATPPPTCVPLYGETRLFYNDAGGDELRPDCAYHLGSELSLVLLKPRLSGFPFLPLLAREPQQGDIAWVTGYALADSLDAGRRGTVTLTTGPRKLTRLEANTAEGMSGGPYITTEGFVIGIHQAGVPGGGSFAHMTPIADPAVRTALLNHLPPVPEVLPPRQRPEAAAEAAARCRDEKQKELLTKREPFSHPPDGVPPDGVHCTANDKVKKKTVAYNVSQKKPGYAISGFVSHSDDVKNGWVGMLRYTGIDGLNMLEVEVEVACDATGSDDGEGWARVTLTGNLRRIDDQKARDEIVQACRSGGQ